MSWLRPANKELVEIPQAFYERGIMIGLRCTQVHGRAEEPPLEVE